MKAETFELPVVFIYGLEKEEGKREREIEKEKRRRQKDWNSSQRSGYTAWFPATPGTEPPCKAEAAEE